MRARTPTREGGAHPRAPPVQAACRPSKEHDCLPWHAHCKQSGLVRALLLALVISWAGAARADFLDDESAHATELAARRHNVETRLIESWLRALRLSETQIASRLAAMSDEDLH